MPIERKLTAEQYDAAPDEDKSLYAPDEDGSYKFVAENAGQLKRGKERLAAEKHSLSQDYAALKDKVAQYEAEKEETEHKKAVAKSKTEEVEARWKKKYDRDLGIQKEQLARLQSRIRDQHREGVINAEVNDVALPQYKEIVRMLYDKRVGVDLDADGVTQVVIKDEDGGNSLDSIKDLTASFKKDKRYKEIFKADSVGSGTVKQAKANDGRIPPVGDSVGHPSLGVAVPQGLNAGMNVPQGQDFSANMAMGGMSVEHERFNQFLREQNPETIAKFTGPPPTEPENVGF